MDKDNKEVFSAFTAKAIQRIKDKKVRKHRRLHIPSLDEEIVIRNLDYPEIVEIMETDDGDDPNASDKYCLYLAVIEPSLKDLAIKMKDEGLISEYTNVTEIFEIHEMHDISIEIMDLSGVTGKKKVTVIEELKN